jgi:WD40 repeat protein
VLSKIFGTNPSKFFVLATLSEHTDGVLTVAFNSDGTLLATGSSDKSVKLWNILKEKGGKFHQLTKMVRIYTQYMK